MPGLFQGDILLTGNNNQNLKTLLATSNKKWPNGIVYYTINTASYSKVELYNFT